MLITNDIYIEEISHLQNKNFKPVSQNRKNAQANSSNSDDLLVRDMPCNCGDCFIGKMQSCEKVETIGNHRRVTMVETSCENKYERIYSDSDTIENIIEKGMVVTVLVE